MAQDGEIPPDIVALYGYASIKDKTHEIGPVSCMEYDRVLLVCAFLCFELPETQGDLLFSHSPEQHDF